MQSERLESTQSQMRSLHHIPSPQGSGIRETEGLKEPSVMGDTKEIMSFGYNTSTHMNV